MGKIFYVMGKSASGKDTIYKRLLERLPMLRTVVPYTTRPQRSGETEGMEYHFTTAGELEQFEREGRMIEVRTYHTLLGPWIYCTVNDGQIDLTQHDYLMIGTLKSYRNTMKYFGPDRLIPLYVEVEDGERLSRALLRERQQEEPKYAELCRRYLADEEDFSEEKLLESGIEKRYKNMDADRCLDEIEDTIRRYTAR